MLAIGQEIDYPNMYM